MRDITPLLSLAPQGCRFSVMLVMAMAAWALPNGPHPVPAAAAPAQASAENRRSAAAHFQRGLELSLLQNWPAAEAEYREAVRLDPHNPRYRSYLADALAAQGRFEKAQQSSQQGKRLKQQGFKPAPLPRTPASSGARSSPRVASKPPPARSSGRPETPGSAVLPPSSTTDRQSATTTRRSEDGLVTLTTPRGAGGFPDADAALEHPRRLYEEGKWAQAETAFRAALRLNPKLDEGWNGLGDACFKQQKWSDAEKAYREALRLMPEWGYYHAQLASALLKRNRRGDAMKEALEAARLGVEDHEVFDELGLTGSIARPRR